MDAGRSETRLAAVMFTDIVGFADMTARDEEAGRRVRRRHEDLARPIVEQYGGRWVERVGDESLSIFSSAGYAVDCALAVQAALRKAAEFKLRIGIHLGDIAFDEDGVAGNGVNIAARVRPFAEPGGVAISQEVHSSVQGRPHLTFEFSGEKDVSPRPIGIYAVLGEPGPAPKSQAALALARPEQRSIAVLPLENLGEPEHERVADGVTDAVIESLARVGPELRVISRTSVIQYKGTRKTAGEIAAELNVELLVEGTVLREDDEVLVRLQLIDAERDDHLWAEGYERKFAGVLRLGREIARTVAGEMAGILKPGRQALLAPTRLVDSEALDLYLRARTHWKSSLRVAHWGREAAELLERCVELCPDFAEGWLWLASVRFDLGRLGLGLGTREAFDRAQAAAETAIQLDSSLGAAHAVLGYKHLYADWDFVGAQQALERALRLSPNDPFVLTAFSAYLTTSTERAAELAPVSERLLRTAPLDTYFRSNRLADFLYVRQHEQAVADAQAIRRIDPEFTDGHLAWHFALLGLEEEAVHEFSTFLGSIGEIYRSFYDAFAVGADQGGLKGGLTGLTRFDIEEVTRGAFGLTYVVGMHLAYLGETEEAIDWLERALEERDPLLIHTRTDPRLDPIRSDPRFQDLLRRIGFPED